MIVPFTQAAHIAERLRGRHFVSAEFMYRPRPQLERPQRVFDYALSSRLHELARHDDAAVMLLCNDQATLDSFAHLEAHYPRLTIVAAIVNPEPVAPLPADIYAETPVLCGWESPEQWRRYALTDRWARIAFALDVARQIPHEGYLIMPAQDAVWGPALLNQLVSLSLQHQRRGQPAAISPYTYHQHSQVPGTDIPQMIIDALNAAFARDSSLRRRIADGDYQCFWGKMGLLPYGLCDAILQGAHMQTWEDDLEIDRVIRQTGYGLYCQWIDDPDLYRQALPIFDRESLKAILDRTLHYSLHIPGKTVGQHSLLNRPLDDETRQRCHSDPHFARAVALSESIIAECNAEAEACVQRFGMSWVDWGGYRHVVRVGDPFVQVWKSQALML